MKEVQMILEQLLFQLKENNKLLRFSKTVLTLEEAADYMGVSLTHLYRLTSQNKIKYSRPSKHIYIKKDDLENYLLQNPVNTTRDIEAQSGKFINHS